MFNNILVVTDNSFQYNHFKNLLETEFPHFNKLFTFMRSKGKVNNKLYNSGIERLNEVDVNIETEKIIDAYDLIISLHCKQIFPENLVKSVKCINIHPGYNPFNRGWYPQVFAIAFGTIIGATIHEMDAKIDHGAIIARKEVKIESYDTSKEVYEKVLELECELIKEYLPSIINNKYNTFYPDVQGYFYSISDYKKLCHIDLEEKGSFKDFINRLRALSHGKYKNAYFIDENNEKIYLNVSLCKEEI